MTQAIELTYATTTTNTNETVYADTATALCSGGHWFMFAGDPSPRLPDGWPCECGAVKYNRREAILSEIEALKRQLDDFADRMV